MGDTIRPIDVKLVQLFFPCKRPQFLLDKIQKENFIFHSHPHPHAYYGTVSNFCLHSSGFFKQQMTAIDEFFKILQIYPISDKEPYVHVHVYGLHLQPFKFLLNKTLFVLKNNMWLGTEIGTIRNCLTFYHRELSFKCCKMKSIMKYKLL